MNWQKTEVSRDPAAYIIRVQMKTETAGFFEALVIARDRLLHCVIDQKVHTYLLTYLLHGAESFLRS